MFYSTFFPQNLLALLQITEADRAAFDVARRLSFGGREGSADDGSAQPASAAASLHSRLSKESRAASVLGSIGKELFGDEDGTGGKGDEIVIPAVDIPDSLFQLEEETEQQKPLFTQVPASAAQKSPMARIEIKTFKVLGLLRGLDADKKAVESDANITEFADLAKDCSRGTQARMFYHLLALTTNNFVRVDQTEAYGEIRIYRGAFF